MPVIVRPPKASGGTTYVEETAAGKLDIIDEEVDKDFTTLYTGVNNLDNDNIQPKSPGQRIAYAKLNLTGQILAADLAPGAAVGAIAPTSIDKTQLKVGATVQDQQYAVSDAFTRITQANVEVLVAELTWTSRSGFYAVWAKLIGGYPVGLASQQQWTTHLRLDGTAGVATDGTILDYGIARCGALPDMPPDASGAAINYPISHAMIGHGALLSAGVHRIKLTAMVDGITYAGNPYIEDRRILVMESA